MPALVFFFVRDPIAVTGGPYKDDKSLRDGSSRGGGLREPPQGVPGGPILVDFGVFSSFELEAPPGCPQTLGPSQVSYLRHF